MSGHRRVPMDAHAFEALYRETRGPLLAYLSRRVSADDRADLLAEVYLVAWRRRDSLPPADELRLWLFGVARRVVAQHRRTTPFTSELVDAEVRDPDDSGPAAAGSSRAVADALASLPEVDRELLTLTAWEQLSPAEAARVVGLTAGAARVRLHRARRRLSRHPGLRALLAVDDAVVLPRAAVGGVQT